MTNFEGSENRKARIFKMCLERFMATCQVTALPRFSGALLHALITGVAEHGNLVAMQQRVRLGDIGDIAD